jgi:hypothetical protein
MKCRENNAPEYLQSTRYLKIITGNNSNIEIDFLFNPFKDDRLTGFKKSLIKVFKNIPLWPPVK